MEIFEPNTLAPDVDSYHHAIAVSVHGKIEFKPLPYSPSPFDIEPTQSIVTFKHNTEDKMWGICKKSDNSLHVVFRSDITRNRVVYMKLNTSADMDARIKEKTENGYELHANNGVVSEFVHKHFIPF